MIKYILVDDEPKILERVKRKIDTIAKDYDLVHVASYSSSKKAYEELENKDYDLLIVDFEMPAYSGMELAEKVASDKKIVFLTSTVDNEQRVINTLDIAGYLSKPLELEKFEVILKNKIIGKINKTKISSKNNVITLKVGVNKDIGFYPERTYYIRTSKKNCINFYGKHDELLEKNVRVNVNTLIKKLKYYNFEKINQGTIINAGHLKHRDNKDLSLQDCKETFKISDSEKEGFINKLRKSLGI